METIVFKTKQSTEYAELMPTYRDGCNAAEEYFVNMGDDRSVIANYIQRVEYRDGAYKVYEAYTDSGSNDYYYFAIKINE